MTTKKKYFLDTAGQQYKITLVVTACTKPLQAQARSNPSTERRLGHGAPPLALRSYWPQLIAGKAPGKSTMFSWKAIHSRIFGHTNYYEWVKKREDITQSWVSREGQVDLGSVRRR